ncbi:hypothetical protein Tco_0378112 [Tanacetum coccineum]
MQRYTCWDFHGEVKTKSNTSISNCDAEYNNDSNNNNRDNLKMLPNLEGNAAEKNHDQSQQLFVDSETQLYEVCEDFTKLSTTYRLMNVKAINGWSDTGFTSLLEALHEMFPKAKLPSSTYQAKKLICPMGMEFEKIDACPKDCMLYKDKDKDLHACRICGKSRLERLFSNETDAKLLQWHAEERKRDGIMRHLADSLQWRNIDNEFKEFGDEIRNIRFGLSSDGINPFGNISPKQPVNDIDIYLKPLIKDMQDIWSKGVEVYDAYKKETFQMRAIIFCTISDFPAYGNLSGYKTKGKMACPVCQDHTHSIWLANCKKPVYMGHQRSLQENHPYRKNRKLFDNNIEVNKLPPPLNDSLKYRRLLLYCFWERGKKALQLQKRVFGKRSLYFRIYLSGNVDKFETLS